MIFHLCRESISHKTEGFPMAFYSVDESHPRYLMMHHWHPEAELLILRKGSLLLTLENRKVQLSEGQFILIPSGTVHSGIPEDAHYECVVFDGNVLSSVLQGSTKKKAAEALNHPRTDSTPPSLSRLTECLAQKEVGYQAEALSFLFSLLTEWIRTPHTDTAAHQRTELRKSRLVSFEKAVLFLQEHYREQITLKDLSEAAGLSENYFGEYFKNVTGKTPFQYLNEYRIERAAERLRGSDLSVTDISLECGFNDLSYFIKTFRKAYGISPNRYRTGNP